MGGGFHTHWQTNHLRVVLKCYAAQDCKDGLEVGVSEPANDASFSDVTGGHSHGGTRKTPMIQQAQQRMFWGYCACPAPLLGRHWWPTTPFRLEATVLMAAFSSERSPPNRSLYDSVSILTPHPGLPSQVVRVNFCSLHPRESQVMPQL